MERCNSESETTADPNDSSDEELVEKFTNIYITVNPFEEEKTGEWIPEDHHPWGSETKPDPNLKMDDTVAISLTHPISYEWVQEKPRNPTGSNQQTKSKWLDLNKIFWNLPVFIQEEMQGSINCSRHELEQLVHIHYHDRRVSIPRIPSPLPPHTREILNEIESEGDSKDSKSLAHFENFKATSFPENNMYAPKTKNCFHLDCEFVLLMYVPTCWLQWFDVQQCDHETGKTQWIRKIRYKYKEKRWIFIPSFRRAQIALLEWPQDHIMTQESTIRLLVMRPSEFEEYVRYCGNNFPVIRLPQDEIGAGYPRYWIQKIALRLKLQFIWMIDDSVECFYEYHPNQEPVETRNGRVFNNYTDYRRRKFGLVFERIEDFVKEADDNERPIAAMSPRRWNPRCRPKKPFSCKPPQGAVYLNLRVLSEKNVNYRPELKTLEDMIFGYECELKGLKVYRDNRILLP